MHRRFSTLWLVLRLKTAIGVSLGLPKGPNERSKRLEHIFAAIWSVPYIGLRAGARDRLNRGEKGGSMASNDRNGRNRMTGKFLPGCAPGRADVVRDDEERAKLLSHSGFRETSRNFTYLCRVLPGVH